MEAIEYKPEIAARHAAAVNEQFFPVNITEIQENFAPSSTPIYVYNVAPLEFNEPRFPNHPHMLIRACPTDEAYTLVNSITHPFPESYRDENGNRLVRWINGYREATRMLAPGNPGTDQNFSDVNALNVGGNLNNFGVFWSTNNPPTSQELKAARKRMETTFQNELSELAKIEAGPGGVNEAAGRANRISHAAVEHFNKFRLAGKKLSYSWHRTDLVPDQAEMNKVNCGACGESIQPTARICIHCGAPTDNEKLERWIEQKFSEKRGPGRPRNEEAA
jgi:hypothetical protein